MDKIFKHSVKTDVGLVRQANEDAAGYAPSEEVCNNGDLFVVCDGMGGHVGGAIASNTAVQSIIDFFKTGLHEDPFMAINDAILFANEQIFGRTQAEPDLKGMGTTCTILLVRDGQAYIGHVGDSRIYLQSDDKLYRITKDHSFVQNLVDQGVLSDRDAESHPRKNELLKAMGIRATVDPEVCPTPIHAKKGDRFLMCSDGLCGLVVDETMNEVLSNKASLDDKADKLIALAKNAGGHDNITVALVEMTNSPFTESEFVDHNPVERLDVTGDMSGLNETQELDHSADFKPTPIWRQTKYQVIGGGVLLLLIFFIVVNPFGSKNPCSEYSVEISQDSTGNILTSDDALLELKKISADDFTKECLRFEGASIGTKEGQQVINFTPAEEDSLKAGDRFWLDCECLEKIKNDTNKVIAPLDTLNQNPPDTSETETDSTQVES